MKDQPSLGLATTKQLIEELAARSEVADTIGEKWPSYKTAPTSDNDRGEFGMPGLGGGYATMRGMDMDGPNYASISDDDDEGQVGYNLSLTLGTAPQTEQAYRIAHNLTPNVLEHFIRRNAEYGESSHVLGIKGQYADINRKVIKLKRYLWDDVEVPDGAESPETIVVELIGHLMIMFDEMLQQDSMKEEGHA